MNYCRRCSAYWRKSLLRLHILWVEIGIYCLVHAVVAHNWDLRLILTLPLIPRLCPGVYLKGLGLMAQWILSRHHHLMSVNEGVVVWWLCAVEIVLLDERVDWVLNISLGPCLLLKGLKVSHMLKSRSLQGRLCTHLRRDIGLFSLRYVVVHWRNCP